jgi:hypothetical protein
LQRGWRGRLEEADVEEWKGAEMGEDGEIISKKAIIFRDIIFRSKCTKNVWLSGSTRTRWVRLIKRP